MGPNEAKRSQAVQNGAKRGHMEYGEKRGQTGPNGAKLGLRDQTMPSEKKIGRAMGILLIPIF